MRELSCRLKRGSDLKETIEKICIDNNVDTAVILSGVGCLYQVRIRLAKAEGFLEDRNDYEIVSLNGTVSKGQAHIHIALSDETGKTIGGHLSEGCLVNTTCELVMGVLEEYSSERQYDQETGYDEICFVRK
ncbi:MAG: DNA-binding protein [Erysipelotrichaceae bacterium]|jgi:predicted DNA-binding protein with PD1-like motif|nr:DNA-binding protein [Erysipelotrichaceae bacterium]MCR5097073.1 DNA-binding protein [Erysipelotrichaceae bacterium]